MAGDFVDRHRVAKRVVAGVLDSGDGMTTDDIKRRLKSLGDDWARLILQCPALNAFVSLWARMPSMTLKDVATRYVELSRVDIGEWLSYEPRLADRVCSLLIEWRDESPNIEDSKHWQHDEALRVCACAFEVRRMALDVARRWHERHVSPAIAIARQYTEEMGLVKP